MINYWTGDADTLDDPFDNGGPLAPMQLDPLCEVRGERYPRYGFEYCDTYEQQMFWLNIVNGQPQ